MKSRQILSGPPGWITEDRTGTSDVREQSEQRALETQRSRISLQPELPDLLWRGPWFFEESRRETVSSWNIIMKGKAIKSWTRYGLYQELWRRYLTKENMTSGHLLNFMLELNVIRKLVMKCWEMPKCTSQPYVAFIKMPLATKRVGWVAKRVQCPWDGSSCPVFLRRHCTTCHASASDLWTPQSQDVWPIMTVLVHLELCARFDVGSNEFIPISKIS